MAVTHKGAISFGLVYIPVSLYTATQDNDISFNQLHKADQSRIRYKKVCTHCGKEVKQEDIVKGFQYEKDKYINITDDEIEKIKTEKNRTIQILQFTSLNQISPVYYDKAYTVTPDKGGDKALELLRLAMMETQRVALGKSVFGSSEKLLIIIPREDGILVQTLMYKDDIKDIPALEKPAIAKAELEMAKKLIDNMEQPFDASEYKDEFQEKIKSLIASKISGKEMKKTKEEKAGSQIIDLMDALRASVKQNTKSKIPPDKLVPPKSRQQRGAGY